MGYIAKENIEPTAAVKKRVLIFLGLGTTLLALAVASFIIDPIFFILSLYTRVDYGSAIYQILASESESVHVSAYLFNITNADRFLSGEDKKLSVQEVGPFTYQENRTNEDFTINTKAGYMTYIPRQKVTFLPEESVGRPEDVQVVMPNVAMLSVASRVSSYSYFAKIGFNIMTDRLKSESIITMNAKDYLWGYDEPIIRLGNTILPGWIDFSKLGLLDRLYDKNATYKYKVSIKNEDKFTIKSVNGVEGLKNWDYEDRQKRSRCNSMKDVYEGIGYPPKLPSSRPIRIYRPILCRFLDLDYLGPTHMEYGIDAMTYRISNKTYCKLPENDCLCSNGICQNGISDISPCFYGLPVVLSNAHFWETDPSLYERIEGIHPNEKEHSSEFIIEPYTGMILTTKFSVQVNVNVGDVDFNSGVSKFSNMVVPVAYVKIVQPKLKDQQIATIRLVKIYSPYILLGVQTVLLLVGFFCVSYSARILYWNWYFARKKCITFKLSKSEVEEAKMNRAIDPLVK